MQAFFLAMVLYLDAQRTAQAQIDAYLPPQDARMPRLDDRARLPYITALLRELMRCFPPLPLGFPHRLMQEDEYDGMRIPENAVILANIWYGNAVSMIQSTIPPPKHSTRTGSLAQMGTSILLFLIPQRLRLTSVAGRHFAEAEIWLMVATTLYCVDIAPAKDADGVDIRPSEYTNSGLVSAISKFECTITPRSPSKQALVEAET